MQKQTLNEICCPAVIEKAPCRGQLALDESALPAIYLTADKNEIIEALLCCQKCRQIYPILDGLPVLIAQPWIYLRQNYDVILALTAEAGQPLSPSMVAYLQSNGCNIGSSGKDDKYSQRDVLGTYLCQHYDLPWDLLPASHPLRGILSSQYPQDFYTAAFNLLSPHLDGQQRVLDIGCGVGRSAYELASRSQKLYGVEFSFGSALAARRVLRHLPQRLANYWLKFEGDIYLPRSLPDLKRDTVEIVVASGDNLPFEDGVFDIVNHWNVLDRIPDPEKLLAEQERVLRVGGLACMADPYTWETTYSPRDKWLGGKDGIRSGDALRQRLQRTCDLLCEQEFIPWLSWKYERNFSLFYCHALVARKKAAKKEQNHAAGA